MIPKNSVKPLELVVSAIHCLKEKNGSSPQKIVRYLEGKYNVDTEVLKPHVQVGLKRGLSFGLITQKSGLYRLNDILSSPNGSSYSDISSVSSRRKVRRPSKGSKKPKIKKLMNKKGRKFAKQAPTVVQKHAKKHKVCKTGRKKGVGNSRRSRNQSEGKHKNQRKQRSSRRKTSKCERRKKIKPEMQSMRNEVTEGQNPIVINQEPEPPKA